MIFTAAEFFKTVDLRHPSVMGSCGISITVEPHQEKDVELIARLPRHFGLICAHHDWAGMSADIFPQLAQRHAAKSPRHVLQLANCELAI